MITCTRAELEQAAQEWRWGRWCWSWNVLGQLMAAVWNMERTLWS